MQHLKLVAAAGLVGALACIAGITGAQDYPAKAVRIITSGVGGGNDLVARILVQPLSLNLGQSFIVDNRGAGIAPALAVFQAAPDGYTLLMAANSLWTGPLLQKTPYDPVKDFAPITLTTRSPYVLVVHPSLPVKTVKELIALAKSKPGALNYSATTLGNGSHIAAELFKRQAGVSMVLVNYKSGGQEAAGLLAGEVQLTFFDAGTAMRYMKARTLRGIAVVSAQRSPLIPELPTIGDTVPGYEGKPQVNGFLAPAKTPDVVLKKLSQETLRVLKQQDVRERLQEVGVEIVGTTPEEFAAEIKSGTTSFARIIKEIGLKIE